jgi:hypothetical protein
MIRLVAVLVALLLSSSSEASMGDRTISGTVLDQRLTGCGLIVQTDRVAALRPFIETSSPLTGSVRLSVTKRSASGTSQTSQGWNFSNGTLGTSSVQIDLPATVSVEMVVNDETGNALCRVSEQLDLQQEKPV